MSGITPEIKRKIDEGFAAALEATEYDSFFCVVIDMPNGKTYTVDCDVTYLFETSNDGETPGVTGE